MLRAWCEIGFCLGGLTYRSLSDEISSWYNVNTARGVVLISTRAGGGWIELFLGDFLWLR